MQLDLNIRCQSLSELAGVLAALGAGGTTTVSTNSGNGNGNAEEQLDETSEEAVRRAREGDAEQPAKPKRRGKAKADTTVPVPTQNPDGSPIEPVREPLPQPTPGGTEAPPAESIPPNQGGAAATADVFGIGGDAGASTAQPAATAEAASGEIDLPALKTAMADLLKVKSAAFAMKTLEDATGCKSLSSGSPSVLEKAKDDPGIMQRAHEALVAGAKAA